MQGYIERKITPLLKDSLSRFPAVVLTGSRQCGKTRLARQFVQSMPGAVVLDLENPRDLAKLADPLLYFEANARRLVCLDEVQLAPDIFPLLRAEIDRDRRPGRFLLLGSASKALVNRSAESLAGRIEYLELSPFLADEYLPGSPPSMLEGLWRGGYPESALAFDGQTSLRWRDAFVRSLIERDLPMLGNRVSPLAWRRFITMCSHLQGQVLNSAKLGASLDLSGNAVRARLEFLQEALLVRLLPAWAGNLKRRLVKAPKLYIRDTGLCHSLLEIGSPDHLMGHPAFGSSWEGWCVETICDSFANWAPFFYRSSGGAELDLVLERGPRRIAFEFKASSVPAPTRGFHAALADLEPERAFLVGIVDGAYPVSATVTACGLRECLEMVARLG
ncbi:MAG: ATP-binding protein [Spirochaetes bacterium]|nr:ATP-binding protein [Spirochaetota bacterium]